MVGTEIQNLNHNLMEHTETETSKGNFPLQILAKKIRLREERELDHDTCYLSKEEVKENRMKKKPRRQNAGIAFIPELCSFF